MTDSLDDSVNPWKVAATVGVATGVYLASQAAKEQPIKVFESAHGRSVFVNRSQVEESKVDPQWITDPAVEQKIDMAGSEDIPAYTILDMFKAAVAKFPQDEALKVERGGDGNWKVWTYEQYFNETMSVARAFIKLGMEAYDAVNILGFNSPEWFIGNMAAIACGGLAAGIYTTNGPKACHFIAHHSKAKIIIVENHEQLKKILAIRRDLPHLKAIVQYIGDISPEADKQNCEIPLLTWSELLVMGAAESSAKEQSVLEQRMSNQKPGNACTLIYTSGTTGDPKAVMISHDNLVYTIQAVLKIMPELSNKSDSNGEHFISYLPLSHIAAQIIDIHAPIAFTALGQYSSRVWFARPDALKGSLATTLRAARPTIFFGVPRVWEKMEEAMKETGKKNKGFKKSLIAWAKDLGQQAYTNKQFDGSHRYPRFHWLAEKLVFATVKKTLGLERCKYLATSAAPIAKETLNFFGSVGLNVCEVYGMSEMTGPATLNPREWFKCGSVGMALPGMTIKIEHVDGRDNANEGEICFKARSVMLGYLHAPEKTAECMDSEGYIHSGDIGYINEAGMLFISGRLKELIITAGGENIAPVPVEDELRLQMPAVSAAMMVGDRRKYNVVLLTLKSKLDKDGNPTSELVGPALEVGDAKSVEEARSDPKWKKYIEDGIKRANAKAVSNAAKIQKFAILPVDFSLSGGDLTPTLKLKRKAVEAKYAEVIEQMYAE